MVSRNEVDMVSPMERGSHRAWVPGFRWQSGTSATGAWARALGSLVLLELWCFESAAKMGLGPSLRASARPDWAVSLLYDARQFIHRWGRFRAVFDRTACLPTIALFKGNIEKGFSPRVLQRPSPDLFSSGPACRQIPHERSESGANANRGPTAVGRRSNLGGRGGPRYFRALWRPRSRHGRLFHGPQVGCNTRPMP